MPTPDFPEQSEANGIGAQRSSGGYLASLAIGCLAGAAVGAIAAIVSLFIRSPGFYRVSRVGLGFVGAVLGAVMSAWRTRAARKTSLPNVIINTMLGGAAGAGASYVSLVLTVILLFAAGLISQ
jgi:hypothetical protein